MKPKNGMTLAQIHKAIHGNKPKTQSVRPKNSIKSVKPQKLFRVNQNNQFTLLNLPFSTTDVVQEIKVSDWFRVTEKADVSVIVPLYKSTINLAETWSSDNLKVELIFVDDNCPWSSKDRVISSFEKTKPVGRIIGSNVTQGWGACCNIGALAATGSILIFLNSETKLLSGWINPLIRPLRKDTTGAVGALHINEDQIVDAGRIWSWKYQKFIKMGSEYYNSELSKPLKLSNCPTDLLALSERESISSSCMAVRRKDFLQLGGFNANLFNKEWSDADFCMTLGENRLKIFCQPNAKISITETHDRYEEQGKLHFSNKWISSERIDKLVKDKRGKKPKIDTILIKRTAAHGDVLVASAIASALKKQHNCKINFMTDHPEILKNNPWIDQVIDTKSEPSFSLFYDLDMVYEYRPDVNILNAYADATGIDQNHCEFFMHTEPIELPENFVTIHAGKTLWVGRNWSTIKFDQLANKIKAMGYNIVSIGTQSDHKVAGCDLDLRGNTNLYQLAYAIKQSKAFIGIDSLPMHIAQVLNKKGVAFFGAIKPETRLYNSSIIPVVANDVKCLGCHHKKARPCTATTICEATIQDCINHVTVNDMFTAIQSILEPS